MSSSVQTLETFEGGSVSIGAASKLRILLVEDNPADVYLFERLLQKISSPERYELVKCDSLLQALALDLTKLDHVFSDYCLPDGKGIDLKRHVDQNHPDLNFILMSGVVPRFDDADIEAKSVRILNKADLSEAILRQLLGMLEG